MIRIEIVLCKIRIGVRCKVRILHRIGIGLCKNRIGIRCKDRILRRIRIRLYRMGVIVLNLSLIFISDLTADC